MLGGCGFCQCEPVVYSLLLVLTQHWFSCRFSGGVASGRERDSSERLVEALAAVRQRCSLYTESCKLPLPCPQAGWLPEPLSCCAELFQSVSSHDVHLLLSAISIFIKVGHLSQPLSTGLAQPVPVRLCLLCVQTNLQELRRGALAQLKGDHDARPSVYNMPLYNYIHAVSLSRSLSAADTGYRDVLKAVLVRNIHKLGNLYAHYII